MMEHQRQGAVDLYRLNEAINGAAVPKLRERLPDQLPAGQPRIVLDLQRVTLLDSAALEWLLDVRDACLRRGGILKLSAANPLCTDILRVTGLVEQLEMYSTEVDAVGSFSR